MSIHEKSARLARPINLNPVCVICGTPVQAVGSRVGDTEVCDGCEDIEFKEMMVRIGARHRGPGCMAIDDSTELRKIT